MCDAPYPLIVFYKVDCLNARGKGIKRAVMPGQNRFYGVIWIKSSICNNKNPLSIETAL